MKKFIFVLFGTFILVLNVNAQIDSIWIGKSETPCEDIEPFGNDTCWESSGWIGPKQIL